MNEDIQVSLKFKDVSGKKVTVDFTGGDVTSDAGVLALKEVAKKIGIIEHLVEAIGDDRHQSYVQHHIGELLNQRIFQIICGYEDTSDSDYLRADPGFKVSCDRLGLMRTLFSGSPYSASLGIDVMATRQRLIVKCIFEYPRIIIAINLINISSREWSIYDLSGNPVSFTILIKRTNSFPFSFIFFMAFSEK